jgi:hypothetical protein
MPSIKANNYSDRWRLSANHRIEQGKTPIKDFLPRFGRAHENLVPSGGPVSYPERPP